MAHKSYSNLLDLASGEGTSGFSRAAAKMPRMSPAAGHAEAGRHDERIILAAHHLPLVSRRDPATGEWSFARDEAELLVQMTAAFHDNAAQVFYVGCLKANVDPSERDEVARRLHELRCVPVWLETGIHDDFYYGYCKRHLWPLFDYMLPRSPDRLHHANLYQAYVAVNNKFATAIRSTIESDGDAVWVHDYHLTLVPMLLRKNMALAKVGFLFHTPFPSLEIYRALPVGETVLRGLLNADVVGFYTFDYARNFLSCCSWLLGLDYELKRGHIVLDYLGRRVTVTILPMDMGCSHDVVHGRLKHDLERAWRENCGKKCWQTGFALTARVIAFPLDFGHLDVGGVVSCYRRSRRRLFFLDYDGTIMPKSCVSMAPTEEIISIIASLCADPENTVFVVSGRGQDTLSEWLSPIDSLGIAAEHGYFLRWSKSSQWEAGGAAIGNLDWKVTVEFIMRWFTEATDGSYVEPKKTGLVWHHRQADDPSFGSRHARNLFVQLKNLLANEPVVVQRGDGIVEAKAQGIGKGLAVQKVISTLASNGNPPDFILSIGDDRSDEDMFESIEAMASSPLLPAKPEVFTCTVGLKPTKAKYYVQEATGVARLLHAMATALA